MKSVHLVVPDLFLPQQLASEVCDDLRLPALGTLLVRAQTEPLSVNTLEAWLCHVFGVKDQEIAALTLALDGVDPGTAYWLRADPVNLQLQRDQMILHTDVMLTANEATQLCASLNAHFATEGLRFLAPHPQRWYLQLDSAPNLHTHPLSQVIGKNAHAHLPHGEDALRWHGVFNEIQMLLFDHEVNQARELRNDLPVNSVWLWGGGHPTGKLEKPYTKVYSDYNSVLAFALNSGIPCENIPEDAEQTVSSDQGDVLIVWEGLSRSIQLGNLHAWRESLQQLEKSCIKPLLGLLRAGRFEQITLQVPQSVGARRFILTRGAMWKMWLRPKPLTHYAV